MCTEKSSRWELDNLGAGYPEPEIEDNADLFCYLRKFFLYVRSVCKSPMGHLSFLPPPDNLCSTSAPIISKTIVYLHTVSNETLNTN